MVPIPITSGLCAVSALGLVGLSIPISARRFSARVSLGHGKDAVLHARVRAQANFVEYVPLALITIGLAEADGAPTAVIWICTASLVLGRTVHALGMLNGASTRLRATGMLFTWSALVIGALALGYRALVNHG